MTTTQHPSAAPPTPPDDASPDPARMNELHISVPEGTHDGEGKEKEHRRPRDSKGWDGKLRIGKKKDEVEHGEGAESVGEESQDEEEGPAPEQVPADEDLLDDVDVEEEDVDLVHCRIQSLPALRLERFGKLKRLCLRQNQITAVEIPSELSQTLEEIDLYDNLISSIRGFDAFTELTSLDLSFNKIKHIKRINHLTKLRDLYFVQNKISTIEGLEGLSQLRNLELGANRIREIENLDTLTSLEELWLGKNKITQLKNLSPLTNLKILSIQSNRLTSLSGLSSLSSLEELHISHNAITSLLGLEHNTALRVIDISANPIEHLEGLGTLSKLEELWASNTKIASFAEVERELRDKRELVTVYFEGTPLQRANVVLYRNKVRLALPQVRQIDATYVQV